MKTTTGRGECITGKKKLRRAELYHQEKKGFNVWEKKTFAGALQGLDFWILRFFDSLLYNQKKKKKYMVYKIFLRK